MAARLAALLFIEVTTMDLNKLSLRERLLRRLTPSSTEGAPDLQAYTAAAPPANNEQPRSPPIGSILRNLQSGGGRVDEDGQVLHPSESQQRVASMLQNRFPRGSW